MPSYDGDLVKKAMAAVKEAAAKVASDPMRPVYHFLPPAQWMNDVCGAFHYKDWYHVFFQFNPWSDRWGRGVGWGHARSRDLLRWEFLPPILLPSESTGTILDGSGCAIIRADGCPMIFFTHTPIGFTQKKRQQWAALPVDDELVRWERVDIGLAPGKSGIPEDINAGWADMFLFSGGGRTLATFKSSDGLVCEAGNPELTRWHTVGHMDGVDGECPNMFELDGYHVLIRSTYPISYIVGRWLPGSMNLEIVRPSRTLDHGYGGTTQPHRNSRGLYGTTVFRDARGRALLMGWVSGFEEDRGWNGCASLPRELSLDGDLVLRQSPLSELADLRKSHVGLSDVVIDRATRKIVDIRENSLEIIAQFQPLNADSYGIRLRYRQAEKDQIVVGYAGGQLNVGGTLIPWADNSRSICLHIFLDRSVIEVFIDEGRSSVTRVVPVGHGPVSVEVFAEGGSAEILSVDAWEIEERPISLSLMTPLST